MEYFNERYEMDLLKNHIFRDPICDWFEIQNIKNIIYNKDKNNYFRKYILNETISYKNKFFNNLKKKILEIHPNKIIYKYTGTDETIHLINNNYPIIFNPFFINNKYNISVSVDILITKSLFCEIFQFINNVNFNNINSTGFIASIP